MEASKLGGLILKLRNISISTELNADVISLSDQISSKIYGGAATEPPDGTNNACNNSNCGGTHNSNNSGCTNTSCSSYLMKNSACTNNGCNT